MRIPVASAKPATVNSACIGRRSMLRRDAKVCERKPPMPVRSTSEGR
jgi:hypothetical protein